MALHEALNELIEVGVPSTAEAELRSELRDAEQAWSPSPWHRISAAGKRELLVVANDDEARMLEVFKNAA